jgi:hypothetical protein
LALLAGAAGFALLAWSAPVLAQCAMCKNAVTGSPDAGRLSESLNLAIIVMLIPPVLIFCGIFFLAFRYRKARGADSQSTGGGGGAAPGEGGGRAKTVKAGRGSKGREAGGALA